MFGNLRARLDMRERRRQGKRKTRSDSQTIRFGRSVDGRFVDTHSVQVSNLDIPIIVIGFVLNPPTLLTGQEVDPNSVNGKLWTKVENESFNRLVKDGHGFKIGSFNATAFCRMLAKIAHGFASAELGLCNFEPLLPDLILGRTTKFHHLIGGPGRIADADTNGGHRLRLEVMRSAVDGKHYHAVNIQLFAPLGAPEYYVLVGERR
jgi:hypothetical protein